MKKIFIIIILLSICAAEKINLNSATIADLISLNLTLEQAEDIITFRQNSKVITNLYELEQINSISIQEIHSIRSLVKIEDISTSTFVKDFQRASYKMGQWISAEGANEGLSEIWLDRFIEPQNINNMNYDDLMALPNLSPIDAVAVLKQKKRGQIKGTFELKNSPGISYWGYKNLVDFIRFTDKPKEERKIHIRFNSLVQTISLSDEEEIDETFISSYFKSIPEQFHKFSLTSNENVKLGLSYHQYMGQRPNDIYTLKRFMQIEKKSLLGNLKLERLVLGNFTVGYGQGVIMETNDNFSPRRTGYGFSKRTKGIHGDITRSCQYVMDGAAIQLSWNNFKGSFFLSEHPRDAVLNNPNDPDSIMVFNNDTLNISKSFTSMIVMQPRLPYGLYNDTTKIYGSMVGSINERTWGGNVRFSPIEEAQVGFTFFESLYDHYHIPRVVKSITGGESDNDPDFNDLTDYDNYSGDAYYTNYITNSADPEIAAMDTSIGDSPIWSDAKSFFRVRGFNFSTVLNNIAFQGEYGEMLKDNNILKFGRSPSALVLSSYVQFANLNFLILYRNYDLGFDNPYQRSFSNYRRYKTSIFEDSYWLVDPVLSALYGGNPQPQAEEGFYISSRYQFHRSMIGYLNWDTWNRKADNAKYYRTVATIDWRPAFNFRIKFRQKWQARGHFNIGHPSPYYSRESRIQARLRMSRYNQFEILYANGYTTFSPRPRLTNNALGGEMIVGDIGSPDETIGFSITHNASNSFSIKGGSLFIKGFLWYFEDTSFRVYNSENGSFHNWVSFDIKPTALFRIMFKVSHSKTYLSTKIVGAQISNGTFINNPYVNSEDMDYRIQVTYAL